MLAMAPVLLGGLLAVPAATAAPAASPSQPALAPLAKGAITGTPAQILREVPVTEPLVSGFQSGLFQPKGALYKKDAKGCTKRNQLLIKVAVKKPRIGRNCVLAGGEWLADFGRTKVTKASAITLLPLIPDNYVYAQGAYGWTEAQRRAYGQDYPTEPWTPRQTRSIKTDIEPSSLQLYSPSGAKVMKGVQGVLGTTGVSQRGGDARDAQLNAELTKLRLLNPGLFDDWTVATLLNAKSWGLSFGPGTYDNFNVTINTCSASGDAKSGIACNADYSVANKAAQYNITPVPMSASLRGAPPELVNPVNPDRARVPDLSYSAPTGPVIDRFLFGLHAPATWFGDDASGVEGPTNEANIPDVPVGYLRLWDTETTWADIEPANGQFTWRKLEKQIQTAQRTDSRVMLVLGGTPAWAGNGSRQSPPKSIEDWRDYVRTVACRLGPSISAYEIWNEANLTTFWTGTAKEMADLTSAAFEEIRKCNPSALVVAANTTSRATGSFGTFYPQYLQELKARNWPVDAYSVHSYPTASGGANDRIRGIGQFKTMLALAGAPQTTIFDTEVNYGLAGLGEGKVDLTGQNAMALMSRTYIDSARYGFASTFWFVWTATPDSKFGIQFTRQAEAEKTAWRTTYDWLVGAQFQKCLETDEGLVVCQFSKGGGNFSLVWHGDVGSTPISVSTAVLGQLGSRICDLAANCNVLSPGSSPSIGFMPMRIDGAPLPAESGPSTPTAPAEPNAAVTDPPQQVRVEVIYDVSNKADGKATWFPPAGSPDAGATTYAYQWQFCQGGACETFAQGTTKELNSRVDLRKGPGSYRFVVTAQSCASPGGTCSLLQPSSAVTENFSMLRTQAAPPSTVLLGVGSSTTAVTWNAPDVLPRLIKGYEVEIRTMPRGEWSKVATTSKTRVETSTVKTGCASSTSCQARVRTVMTSGLTSAYVTSNEASVQTQMKAPHVLSALWRTTDQQVEIYAIDADLDGINSTYGYPTIAFQLRFSNDGGSTWTTALVLNPGRPEELGCPPLRFFEPGTVNAPYCSGVRFSRGGLAKDSLVQIRAVGDYLNALPSDWVRITLD